MALQTNGRVLFFDAPGTYAAVFPAKALVSIDEVVVEAGGGAGADIDIYAAPDATDATKQIVSVIAAAGDTKELIGISDTPGAVPLSMNGLTVVLTGVGSKAWVYLV